MGNTFNKHKKKFKIMDFDKVIIPKEYELIKISSHNVNIRNSVNITNKIREIVSYIVGLFKNKENDIICLQGIHDYNSAYKLIKELKIFSRRNRGSLYFAPEFEDVDSKSDDTISIRKSKLDIDGIGIVRSSNTKRYAKKVETQNIIISKYPIVSTIFVDLGDKHDIDDLIGTKTMIGANISIYGNIISIYNVELSHDIKSANIINDDVREKELAAVFDAINENQESLKLSFFYNYLKTDIHFLIGSLYITETLSSNLANHFNSEFARFVREYKCVDIFRHIHDENIPLYTNSSSKRHDYIMFLMTNDIYQNNSYLKQLKKLKSSEDLFKLIFKRYKVYFLDGYVRTDNYASHSSTNYPIECIFMLYKNKH